MAKIRDQLSANLRGMGVDASVVEQGRSEEHIAEKWLGGQSEVLIEIQNSPIGWVNVRRHEGDIPHAGVDVVIYTAVYLVSDSTVHSMQRNGDIELKSVRVKSVPLFGRVVDLQWKVYFIKRKGFMLSGQGVRGDRWMSDVEKNLIGRLRDDALLNKTLITVKEDVVIRSFSDWGWAISTPTYSEQTFGGLLKGFPPSREQWDCYERIANHMVESSR